jgi:hypothetical protein
MNRILDDIVEAADSFCFRTGREPDVIWVGLSEWIQISALPMMQGCHGLKIAHALGMSPVACVYSIWSTIAPAIREERSISIRGEDRCRLDRR